MCKGWQGLEEEREIERENDMCGLSTCKRGEIKDDDDDNVDNF